MRTHDPGIVPSKSLVPQYLQVLRCSPYWEAVAPHVCWKPNLKVHWCASVPPPPPTEDWSPLVLRWGTREAGLRCLNLFFVTRRANFEVTIVLVYCGANVAWFLHLVALGHGCCHLQYCMGL